VIETTGQGKKAHFPKLYAPPRTGMRMAIRPAALSMAAPAAALLRDRVYFGSSGLLVGTCGGERPAPGAGVASLFDRE